MEQTEGQITVNVYGDNTDVSVKATGENSTIKSVVVNEYCSRCEKKGTCPYAQIENLQDEMSKLQTQVKDHIDNKT